MVVAGGAALAVAARGMSKASGGAGGTIDEKPAEKYEWKLDLVPLNDELKFAEASRLIARGGASKGKGDDGRSVDLGAKAEAMLTKAEEAAAATRLDARLTAETEALESLKADLDAGIAPAYLRQKLNPRIFVIDFDVRPPVEASPTPRPAPSNRKLLDELREKVSLLLHVASPHDEVVLRVTSPGGAVTDYGLAAAQFARLRSAGVRTTACIDTVAASGGYMLACAADRVLAAPFSIVGSIGVIAGIPNVHKLLDKSGVEYVQRTAGQYKRTVNVFTANTDEGLQKFEEEIQLVHDAFVSHVATYRGELVDTKKVCTGESWLALHAHPLGLVDGLVTSDAYLRSRQVGADVYLVRQRAPPRRGFGLDQILGRVEGATRVLTDGARALVAALSPLQGWSAGASARSGGPMAAEGSLHAHTTEENVRQLLANLSPSSGPMPLPHSHGGVSPGLLRASATGVLTGDAATIDRSPER